MKYVSFLFIFSMAVFAWNRVTEGSQANGALKKSSAVFKETVARTNDTIAADTISTKEYARLIFDRKVQPSDNEQTFRCLQEMISDSANREFYFEVYKAISINSDGALGEVLGGYLKALFEQSPDFCLEQYPKMNKAEKENFLHALAYEFYVSGDEYQADIDDFFGRVDERIESRTDSNIALFADLKRKISQMAKAMDD